MTQQPVLSSTGSDGTRRRSRAALVVMVVLGFFLAAMMPVAASAAPRSDVKVTVQVKVKNSPYLIGQRPVLRIKVTAKHKHHRAVRAKGRVIVKALGEKQKATLRRGKARVRLPELTEAGTVKVRVTFTGKKLPQRKVTKRIKVEAAAWEVPDEALREQIRSALDLPDGHALTLADAADLDNTNGASLFFGDVRTAAGLEVATNLTVLTSFTAANAQDSRGLDNIVRVNGELWISNAVQDASYPRLAHVGGEVRAFNVDAERIRSISMPELVDAKSVAISSRPQLAALALPKLTTVRGDVDIISNPALTSVDLPSLTTVAGSLEVSSLDTATAVRLPSLVDTAGVNVAGAPRVQALDLSRLATVNGELRIIEMPLLAGLSAPVLRQVSGGITVYGLGSITQLRMPALEWSHGNVLLGIGEDFPALPRDGSAVSFAAFRVDQTTDFRFSAKGDTSQGDTSAERWNEFLTHFGVL